MKLLNKNAATKNPAFIKIRLTFLDEYDFGQNSRAKFKTYIQMPCNFMDDPRLAMIGSRFAWCLILILKKYVSLPIEYRLKHDQGTIVVSRSDFSLPNRMSIGCLLSALHDADLAEIIDDTVLVNKRKEKNIIKEKNNFEPTRKVSDYDTSQGSQPTDPPHPRGVVALKLDEENLTSKNQNPKKPRAASAQSIRDEIELLYKNLYPRREGKSKGLSFLISTRAESLQIKTAEDVQSFELAVKNYVANLVAKKTDPNYYKLFSTFAHEWRDWLDESSAKGALPIPGSQINAPLQVYNG